MAFVIEHLPKRLNDRSVVVITSKIIALSEKRTANLSSEIEKDQLIKQESDVAIKTNHGWLTIKNGIVMASAGIDQSNGNGKLVLLPQNSFATARQLWQQLRRHYMIKNLGILITDSRTIPFKQGIMGVALGYHGFGCLKDYRHTPDLFGRQFKTSRTNIVEALATAAVLVMGEGAEQQPLAIITHAPLAFTTKKQLSLTVKPQDDLYRPLFVGLT